MMCVLWKLENSDKSENSENLPTVNENSVLSKLKDTLQSKISTTYSWINTGEGKIVSRIIASLGSFAVGDPTGMIVPLILECSDHVVRKRFIKHFPDLLNKLESEKLKINEKFLKSAVGQQLLRDTLREIIHEDNEEKIEYLKSFLLNSYVQQNPNEIVIKRYQKLLLQMDSSHLQILSSISSPYVATLKVVKDLTLDIVLGGAADNINLKDYNTHYFKMNKTIFETSIQDLKTWGIADLPDFNFGLKDPPDPKTLAVNKKLSVNGTHAQAFVDTWWKRDHSYSHEELSAWYVSSQMLARISDFGWDFIQYVKKVSK